MCFNVPKYILPESGAVFTYGRSHLTISGDGHDNNYFFVKNDPVRKLICGRSQSAVICGKVDGKFVFIIVQLVPESLSS